MDSRFLPGSVGALVGTGAGAVLLFSVAVRACTEAGLSDELGNMPLGSRNDAA
jgi:hypothetical protein